MFQIKVVKKIKIHILCSVTFFPENRGVYETMSKNVREPKKPQKICLKCVACASTHTHALTHARAHTQKYVILIAFPRQQWFRERASILLNIRTLPVLLGYIFVASIDQLLRWPELCITGVLFFCRRLENRSCHGLCRWTQAFRYSDKRFSVPVYDIKENRTDKSMSNLQPHAEKISYT